MADQDAVKGSHASGVKKKSRRPPEDFLDSVFVKMGLSFDQIKEHTNIDSTYYKEHVKFTGDTVWYRNSKHPLAIVRCADSNLNKKLLLVFNRRGKCTASLIVGMNGDVDGLDSVILNYKIIDDYSFTTTETWTYRGGKTDDKITVTKQFYWINKKGNILAQNNIIHSFTRPKRLVARR
ncbi:MAG TPA: hypothetical protein VFE54_00130 [Mucilaginibacter sp.]|nr:hypothetical protein [Mucilaginibacter sp.]